MNKVSVIIPIYNAEPYLSEMLDSILAQTWQNIQLVAVNDGSSDRTWEIIRNLAERDERILLGAPHNVRRQHIKKRGPRP